MDKTVNSASQLAVWRLAARFNYDNYGCGDDDSSSSSDIARQRFLSRPRYVLLITSTPDFNLERDVRRTLRIYNQHFINIKRRLVGSRVAIEYITAFTNNQRKNMGPIAQEVSERISVLKLKRTYADDRVIFVGPVYFQKFFPRIFSIDHFLREVF